MIWQINKGEEELSPVEFQVAYVEVLPCRQ
jgi:hypothetical protein